MEKEGGVSDPKSWWLTGGVTTAFNEEWAERTVAELRNTGVEFAAGLDEADVAAIGVAFDAQVPSELALFLQVGVPVSDRWAKWTDGPDAVAATTREWIEGSFAFDIEQEQYWHSSFGERPEDPAQAVEAALAVVAKAPALLPVYGHRHLATAPTEGPRAVLSVWQAVDSIYYGNDLADYFAREFSIGRPSWVTSEPPPVPVWEDLFGWAD